MLTLLLMGYGLIQEAQLSATMRGVEKDCWEALHLSHFKAIEEALDKMSFWQVVKIILKGGLKEIFAPLLALILLLIFSKVWVSAGVASAT